MIKKTTKRKPKVDPNPAIPTKVPHTMGPPIKYTPEWIEEEAKQLLLWVKRDEGLYIGDFAHERGYSRQRLGEFEKKSESFKNAMDRARLWQERKFIHGGLFKDMDPGFVRFMMARLCGPIWKSAYDTQDDDKEKTIEVTINEIKKC